MTSPDRLELWLHESGLLDAPAGFETLDGAVELREAIYALLTAHLSGAPYSESALSTVNRFASQPPPTPELLPTGRRSTATPQQALSLLARDAITVLSSPDAALLKTCSRAGCTQVYLDRSRGGRREWCSMLTCGNRAKAGAYRARNSNSERLDAAAT